MLNRILTAGCLIAILISGCLPVDYRGASYAPTQNVKFYRSKTEIPQPFKVMGRAVCSGDYSTTSQEEIVQKLIQRAESAGADAVLLHEYAIVPTGSVREHQLLDMSNSSKVWAENGRAVSGWNELDKDFATRYGAIGKKKNKPQITQSYRRIIQVEFLKYLAPATKTRQ